MRVNRIISSLISALLLLCPGIAFAEWKSEVVLTPTNYYDSHFTVTPYETEPGMDENLMSVAINDENQLAVLQADYSKHVLSVYDDELNWIHGKELVIFNGKLVNPVVFYWEDMLYVRFFDDAGDVNVLIDCADTNNVYTLSGVDFMDIANIALNDRPAVNISPKSKYKLHEFDNQRLVVLDENKSEIVLYDYSKKFRIETIAVKLFMAVLCTAWVFGMIYIPIRYPPSVYDPRWYRSWSARLTKKWYE